MNRLVILLCLLFYCTIVRSQPVTSYGLKNPTIETSGFTTWCYDDKVAFIYNFNNGGYATKRIGIIACKNCDYSDLTEYQYAPYRFTWNSNLTSGVEYIVNANNELGYFQEGDVFIFRWFVETSDGTMFYGDKRSNTVGECETSPLNTLTVTTCVGEPSYNANYAVACGSVISSGSTPITAYGVVYANHPNATTSDNIAGGSGSQSSFTAVLSPLIAGQTYYYRAYATNSGATAYGAEYSFTTLPDETIPSVVTASVSGITETSATSGGSITSDGGGNIVVKGLEYSTNASFSSGVFSVPGGDGSGSFTSTMNSLTPCTTYYARAFAANSNGTGYGNVVAFTTNCSCNLPSFSAAYCSNPTSNSISVGATISSDGGCNITNRGFQYSTDPLFNSIAGSVSVGSGSGSYSTTITGLACGNTYFFRPFATNSAGTYYANSLVGSGCTTAPTSTPDGNQISFPYLGNPIQVTTAFTNSGCNLTERGVVWSTAPNPTISDNKYVSSSNAEGSQTYTISITPGTYYFSAYAINNQGVTYYHYTYPLTIPAP